MARLPMITTISLAFYLACLRLDMCQSAYNHSFCSGLKSGSTPVLVMAALSETSCLVAVADQDRTTFTVSKSCRFFSHPRTDNVRHQAAFDLRLASTTSKQAPTGIRTPLRPADFVVIKSAERRYLMAILWQDEDHADLTFWPAEDDGAEVKTLTGTMAASGLSAMKPTVKMAIDAYILAYLINFEDTKNQRDIGLLYVADVPEMKGGVGSWRPIGISKPRSWIHLPSPVDGGFIWSPYLYVYSNVQRKVYIHEIGHFDAEDGMKLIAERTYEQFFRCENRSEPTTLLTTEMSTSELITASVVASTFGFFSIIAFLAIISALLLVFTLCLVRKNRMVTGSKKNRTPAKGGGSVGGKQAKRKTGGATSGRTKTPTSRTPDSKVTAGRTPSKSTPAKVTITTATSPGGKTKVSAH